ncbi:hypothetical protein [Pseudomonas sp. BIC9C]|uniref:hypothetical protein n=1 Tax=Pseudomonas sp. BIC9C TaxID=3078458 RepID=UPI002AD2A644|nr:hypothetical protein [Pseudomonas sp. BIC9C]
MRIAWASVPGHTTMVSVAAPWASMTVTAMACCTMIATLSMVAATVTATAFAAVTATAFATVAATAFAAVTTAAVTTASGATATVTTATTSAAAIFGIHAGETTDVIGHQDSRCRQDSANCQSQ